MSGGSFDAVLREDGRSLDRGPVMLREVKTWLFGRTWQSMRGEPVPPNVPSLFQRISRRLAQLRYKSSFREPLFFPDAGRPAVTAQPSADTTDIECDGEDSIPASWLDELTTIEAAEAANMIDGRPFGYGAPRWQSLKQRARSTDELWWFGSPPDMWRAHAGRMGLALVRDGKIVASITTMMT